MGNIFSSDKVDQSDNSGDKSKCDNIHEDTSKNSCGIFKRKRSSIFLDYDGQSFEEYIRRKRSIVKGLRNRSGRNSIDSVGNYVTDTASLDNIGSEQGWVNAKSNLGTNPGNTKSLESLPISEPVSPIHRPHLKFSYERQVSFTIEEVMEMKTPPAHEALYENNGPDSDQLYAIPYAQLENQDSDEFYRPWSIGRDVERHTTQETETHKTPDPLQSPPPIKDSHNNNHHPIPLRRSDWSSHVNHGANFGINSVSDKRAIYSSGSSRNTSPIRSEYSVPLIRLDNLYESISPEPKKKSNVIYSQQLLSKNESVTDKANDPKIDASKCSNPKVLSSKLNGTEVSKNINKSECEDNGARGRRQALSSFVDYEQVRVACGLEDITKRLEGLSKKMNQSYVQDNLDQDQESFIDSENEESQDLSTYTENIDRLREQVEDLSVGSSNDVEGNQKHHIKNKLREEGLDDYFSDADIPDLEVEEAPSNRSSVTFRVDKSWDRPSEDSGTQHVFEEDSTGMSDFDRSGSTKSCSSVVAHILGSAQTQEIRGSWAVILADLQTVGVQCMVDLFEIYPFVRDHFKELLEQYGQYDPEDDNVLHSLLENHAKLVMNTLHDFVTHLDDIDPILERLQKLGLFHVKNNVPKHYLDIMGPIFCNAVRPILLKKNIWKTEVEDAWMELFKILINQMKKSYDMVETMPQQIWLVPTEKCIIVATWNSIFLKHMNTMGKSLFIDMFKMEPNVLKYFDAFRDVGLSNLLQNRAFQNHGIRIMNLVKYVVENLDNPEKLQDHMLALGRMHVKKGIESKHLSLMGPTFCQAIRPMVMAEGTWSLDIDQAWAKLFRIFVSMMDPAYSQMEMGGKFPSANQAKLLLESWEEFESSLDEIGEKTFVRLFESHANIKSYFPSMKKLSHADLELSRSIKEHSDRIMRIVRLMMSNINDLTKMETILDGLGRSHYARGIKSEYLDVMGPIFCNTIRPIFVRKDLWSLQLEEVWLALFKKISDLMKQGYPKEKRKTSKFLKNHHLS